MGAMDQLLGVGAAKDYGRGTEVVAINLTGMQLAAFRRALPLPEAQANLNPMSFQAWSTNPVRIAGVWSDLALLTSQCCLRFSDTPLRPP